MLHVLHAALSGAYKLRVTYLDGRQQETDWFDNLITDSGLDALAAGSITRCCVGTGSTPPANSDTGLSGTPVAYATSGGPDSTGTQTATPPYYAYANTVFTFTLNAVIGTIKEVAIGIGTTNSITTLFSRTLINGGDGITLASGSQLQVIYQFRRYVPDDVSFNLTIDGVARSCIARPLYISSANYWAPSLASPIGVYYPNCEVFTGAFASNITNTLPTGSRYAASSGGNQDYVAGTYERYFWLEWTPARGTFTATIVSPSGYNQLNSTTATCPKYQISVSPGIAKTNLQTLRLEGKYSWGRHA